MKFSKSTIIRIILWIIMLLGGAFFSLYYDLNSPLFHSWQFHLITAILGLFIIKVSFKAAGNSGRDLKKYGRVGDIPRLETNKLAKEGLYACMRHPMLFALTLLPLGWALLLGLPTFIFVIAPLEMIFIIAMVLTLEEKEAIAKFGNEYIEYKSKVPAFHLKCLKQLLRRKNEDSNAS